MAYLACVLNTAVCPWEQANAQTFNGDCLLYVIIKENKTDFKLAASVLVLGLVPPGSHQGHTTSQWQSASITGEVKHLQASTTIPWGHPG